MISKRTGRKAQPGRLHGLTGAARRSLERIDPLLHLHRWAEAEQLLAASLALAPGHPAVLERLGRLHLGQGRNEDAMDDLGGALRSCPDDPELLDLLAAAQAGAGQVLAAANTLQRACTIRPEPARWLSLGATFDACGEHEAALDAAERALALDPNLTRAGFLKARSLQALGRIAETAQAYRSLLAKGQAREDAWFGLLDIKTVELAPGEFEALATFASDPGLSSEARMKVDFAFGQACERLGRYSEAFAAFDRANAAARERWRWNATEHHAQVEALARTSRSLAAGPDGDARGSEVIFVVGLPRSGSTLVEQILSAHSLVEGASELPDLGLVLNAESRRRGTELANWAPRASPADWQRLGGEYLERTARWRSQRPISTDKALDNWKYVGVIRAMLPGSRIIDCRRDPLETCWSCYKQMFAPGLMRFSYAFADLAACWKDYAWLTDFWQREHPGHVRVQALEAILADAPVQVRQLLDFCGLPFEAGCLSPEDARRAVRTASSAQVRQPMRRQTGVAGNYGNLLDALRQALT
ncbi:Sulfotransferase family protein [Dokdonella immobilis]|uniref:Sulfotransferase family protein n=1 Tax=Dokdonella immobilis TaxID=578942 RepID=A0A1I4VJX2_9GAMM|nr:Sulfotransferase family protein [Dokdonella immobilis]